MKDCGAGQSTARYEQACGVSIIALTALPGVSALPNSEFLLRKHTAACRVITVMAERQTDAVEKRNRVGELDQSVVLLII